MIRWMTSLLPGLVLALCFNSAAELRQHTLTITAQDGRVEITENHAPVLRYTQKPPAKKPFVLEWRAPGGENILRNAPEDHPHHHGLMFAITVEGVNFWEEYDTGGYQEHVQFTETQAVTGTDAPHAAFREALAWRAPDTAALLLSETRQIMHHARPEADYRLLTWTSTLETPPDRDYVTLSGTAYHGLGMRFVEWMDAAPAFVLAEDMTGELIDGNHRLAQASWSAYTVDGEQGEKTVAMFDAPTNPRPALWFMMVEPFGYLSATIDLWREPLELRAAAPITLRYGVAVWDAVVDAATIEDAYATWQGQMEHL